MTVQNPCSGDLALRFELELSRTITRRRRVHDIVSPIRSEKF